MEWAMSMIYDRLSVARYALFLAAFFRFYGYYTCEAKKKPTNHRIRKSLNFESKYPPIFIYEIFITLTILSDQDKNHQSYEYQHP